MNRVKDYKFKLCTSCATFNQAEYIVDALNGFTVQQTSFPFVCVIMDDASTDGEQEVIKTYLQEHFDLEDKSIVRNEETDDYVMTFAQHKMNKNCFFVVYYLKYNHYSIQKTKKPYLHEWHNYVKYLAFCEGDDFWINPLKLQKQVDALEHNTTVSACFGNSLVKNEVNHRINRMTFPRTVYTMFDIMSGLMPGIQNICCRKEVYYLNLKSISNGDLQLYYKCACYGNLQYMNEDFAVYRITGKGVATSRRADSRLEIAINHRYVFHKEMGFRYNRALVKSQSYHLAFHILHCNNIRSCCKIIRKYHAPTNMRFFWYIVYVLLYFNRTFCGILLSKHDVDKL